jgi:hypothetical protein
VTENAFFTCLIRQVDRMLENNRQLTETIDKITPGFCALRLACAIRQVHMERSSTDQLPSQTRNGRIAAKP